MYDTRMNKSGWTLMQDLTLPIILGLHDVMRAHWLLTWDRWVKMVWSKRNYSTLPTISMFTTKPTAKWLRLGHLVIWWRKYPQGTCWSESHNHLLYQVWPQPSSSSEIFAFTRHQIRQNVAMASAMLLEKRGSQGCYIDRRSKPVRMIIVSVTHHPFKVQGPIKFVIATNMIEMTSNNKWHLCLRRQWRM